MIELGRIFMYLGQEYKIVFINEKKSRINIEPVITENTKNFRLPQINQKIVIDNTYEFKIVYVNEGKKRISLEQRRG